MQEARIKGRMEKLDWTGLWTGLDWFFEGGNFFLEGGRVVLFFLVCKKIAFSTFPQQAIFLHLGGRGEGRTLLFFLSVF